MALDYRHIVVVVQLVAYVPAFVVALLVAARHGFGRSAGWVFLVLFSFVRIVGSCAFLATLTNQSIGVYITAAICDSIALSPLIMATVGLLSRVNDSISRLNPLSFKIVHVITIVGLILTIVGQTSNTSQQGLTQVQSTTKVGIVLFIASWICLCVLLLVLGGRRDQMGRDELHLLYAVAISVPFIFVRLVYSVLSVFVHNSTFNVLTGNVTVTLFMAVLTEFAVVAICLGIGLTLENRTHEPLVPVQDRENEMHFLPESERGRPTTYAPQQQEQKPPRTRRARRGGPIRMLIGVVRDAVEDSRHGA